MEDANIRAEDDKSISRSFLVMKWVKDLALSVQRLGLLLWLGFDPWP